MKRHIVRSLQTLMAVISLSITTTLPAEVAARPETLHGGMEYERLLAEMREVMAAAGYPALITVDEGGQPRARTVDAFEPDAAMTVWIATRPNTRKVAQIRNHPAVTLYYFDASSRSYVTLMGQAELVDDVETKMAMRRDRDGARLYPDFPDDYLLIKITAEYLEALVPSYRGDPETWAPIRVDLLER